MQIALQTDYLHGKLEPHLVAILDVSGIFGFNPGLVYRLTDNVLLSANTSPSRARGEPGWARSGATTSCSSRCRRS